MGHQWQAIGRTVCGAAHKRAGLTNQDSITWYPILEPGPPLVMAVSDGHGSAKSFRSHWGSAFAVETAREVIREVLRPPPAPIAEADLSDVKRLLEERLPGELVRNWEARVSAHFEQYPFTTAELEKMASGETTSSLESLEENPLLAYGATLITILVTQDYIAYAQLGDGDVLTVSDTGEVSRPLPDDERLFANETTSLCTKNAWGDFRTAFQVITNTLPALILASTDGYSNSFLDETNFLKVGSDLLEMLRTEGLSKISASLDGWLEQASQEGSGDDITLGVICRMDALQGGAK
jgi:serine/threonine protein phosphatase PrpC